MPAPVRQAVVLCAGRGTRLGTLTAELPKPMLPIAGKPLIAHLVDKLFDGGSIEHIILVVGHRGELLQEYFAHESRITIAWQPSPKGTADALLAAEAFLQDRFLLTYGDLWLERFDYHEIVRQAEDTDALYLAVNQSDRPQGAAVYLDDHAIVRVIEKPTWNGQADTCWNAAGLFVLSRDLLKDCRNVAVSPRGELELATAIQRAIDRGVRFVKYVVSQPQVDIGVPQRYEALCQQLSRASGSSSSASELAPSRPPMRRAE